MGISPSVLLVCYVRTLHVHADVVVCFGTHKNIGTRSKCSINKFAMSGGFNSVGVLGDVSLEIPLRSFFWVKV